MLLRKDVSMEQKLFDMSQKFEREGFTFSEEQKRKFYTFYKMLIEKNKVMNLTGITEFDEVVEKHFIDSVCVSRVVDLSSPLKILDLGTGAGFPGIPLKIAFPELNLTLMDSLKKRISFLDEVIAELKLTGISTIHARAEELARKKEYREQFDLCVSRAVANLSTLEEYCLPFVHVGGTFVSYKSGDVDEELSQAKRACRILGGELEEVYRFHLEENRRSFVVIRKIKKTPGMYPRKAGTPSKLPL